MNLGVLRKGLREVALITVLCGLAVLLFESLMTYLFWQYRDQFTTEIMEMEFVRDIIESLVGMDLGGEVGLSTLSALAWVHPVVLSLVWAHEIAICTRMPAGEIDRGTVDFLLAQPISRWRVLVSETVVWLLAGVVLMILALVGNAVGHEFIPEDARTPFFPLAMVVANLYLLYLTVGAFTLLVSSYSDRRGRAVGVVFGVVLFNFLWNFLGQYWSFADRHAYLSILNYFKPMPILDQQAWPWADSAVLVGLAAILWAAAAVVFTRRDICTV